MVIGPGIVNFSRRVGVRARPADLVEVHRARGGATGPVTVGTSAL